MSILSFGGVTVRFGARTLLRDVTFTVDGGERWGIVGRNGAGKTTLFRLITGAMEPTAGAVVKTSGLRVSLLDQLRDFGSAATVWEAAAAGYRDALALERLLERQGERLAELGEAVTEADLVRYGRDQDAFAHAGGYEFHARVDAVLQGLGFDALESKRRPLAGLSGGEQGRLGLAAQLAAPADVVLLDEPTNHLDLETTDWLRHYLGEFGESVLVISHDRAFLDDTVDHVLHVADGTTTAYRGGYSAFVTQRAERLVTLERQVEQQRRFIAKEEDFIRRNIAGQKTAQAKGRRRRLDRLPRLSPPPSDDETMALRLEADGRSGDQVIIAEALDIRIGSRPLVRGFSAVARRGDMIALVGPNGAGKTTFLATLLGERQPSRGSIRFGAGVTPSWFRQDLAQVPLDRTLYESIASVRPAWGRGPIQAHLGRFGFSGDEVQRHTSLLSGGERARLALALIMLTRANLLVLDEPTNHLDVESIEALEDAFEGFEGSAIIVSHDRAFLRELATRVWAFDGDRIVDFDGAFVEWEPTWAERLSQRAAEVADREAEVRSATEIRTRRLNQSKRDAEQALRTAREAAATLEALVQRLEARVAELEAALGDPALYDGRGENARRAGELDRELKQARSGLDQTLLEWTRAEDTVSRLATSE
ncbi:MAG TPA: ABC-F family ATP-binding cassette domain-containing protein [Gemmatimonadales bacterium]